MTMTPTEALKAVLKAAMETAREEAVKQEAILGRKLTNSEAMQLAELVERQLRTVLAIQRF